MLNNLCSPHYIDSIIALNRKESMNRRPRQMRVTFEINAVDFDVHELPGLEFRADLVAECTVWDDGSVDDTRAAQGVEIYDDCLRLPDCTTRHLCAVYREAILRALTRAAGGYEAVHELARQERDRQWQASRLEACV